MSADEALALISVLFCPQATPTRANSSFSEPLPLSGSPARDLTWASIPWTPKLLYPYGHADFRAWPTGLATPMWGKVLGQDPIHDDASTKGKCLLFAGYKARSHLSLL